MTDLGDARRELLTEELKGLRSSAEALLFAFDRVFNFGLVFAAGVTGLALANGVDIVFIVLPFPVAILYLVLLNLNTEGLSRAGHKKWVEEQLNLSCGSRVALEEAWVAETRKIGVGPFGRASVVGTQFLLGLLLLALFGVGAVNVLPLGAVWATLYFGLLAVVLCLVVLAVRELTQAYRKAYAAAVEATQIRG